MSFVELYYFKDFSSAVGHSLLTTASNVHFPFFQRCPFLRMTVFKDSNCGWLNNVLWVWPVTEKAVKYAHTLL